MENNNKICRACLTTKETFTFFIHQNVSQDLFWFCTSVKVLPNDELPKALCKACHELLTRFSEFKRTCIQSSEALSSINSTVKSDPDRRKTEEACDDSKLILQSLTLAVKSEYEALENSQDDFLDADFKEDFKPKTDRGCKKKKKVKSKSKLRREKRPFCFSCEYCNKRFVDADRYEGHKLTHEGKPVTIQCQPCNKTFHTWYGLTRHKKHVHTTVSLESLRCSLCGKVSKNEQTLQMHQMTHQEHQTVMCDVCGRVFKSKYNLRLHLKTHDEERPKPFTCQHCGNKFQSQSTLKTHLRRHEGQRFICELCGYPFRDKFSLVKHIWKHDGKKLYKCDICTKSFAGKSSLVDHKRLHSGEKPYPCINCGKRFITRRILRAHERTHTGEKPHKCTLCTQAFAQRGTLKRHMKVHNKNFVLGL